MSGTCAAWDNTAPREILEALRIHINADKARNPKGSRFRARQHGDAQGCCLLEDLGGAACSGDDCVFGPADPVSGKKEKLKSYAPHKRLDKPIARRGLKRRPGFEGRARRARLPRR